MLQNFWPGTQQVRQVGLTTRPRDLLVSGSSTSAYENHPQLCKMLLHFKKDFLKNENKQDINEPIRRAQG